jgi:hypothetical protein
LTISFYFTYLGWLKIEMSQNTSFVLVDSRPKHVGKVKKEKQIKNLSANI